MPKIPFKLPYRRQHWIGLVCDPSMFSTPQPNNKKRWIPSTHIRLMDALIIYGQSKIEKWNGAEATARRLNLPPNPPWEWPGVKSSFENKYFTISDENKLKLASKKAALEWWITIEPILNKEWTEETAAWERWLLCQDKIRSDLACGNLSASILADNGKFVDVSSDLWRSTKGNGFLRNGAAEFYHKVGMNSDKISGPLVFKRDFFETQNSNKLDANRAPSLDLNSERFPYLAFMVHVANNAPFAERGRTPKKILDAWIKENWPPSLGEPTYAKITNMATFLRQPKDERGGIHGKGPED